MKKDKCKHNYQPLYNGEAIDPLRSYCLKCNKYFETNPYNGKTVKTTGKHINELHLSKKVTPPAKKEEMILSGRRAGETLPQLMNFYAGCKNNIKKIIFSMCEGVIYSPEALKDLKARWQKEVETEHHEAMNNQAKIYEEKIREAEKPLTMREIAIIKENDFELEKKKMEFCAKIRQEARQEIIKEIEEWSNKMKFDIDNNRGTWMNEMEHHYVGMKEANDALLKKLSQLKKK